MKGSQIVHQITTQANIRYRLISNCEEFLGPSLLYWNGKMEKQYQSVF